MNYKWYYLPVSMALCAGATGSGLLFNAVMVGQVSPVMCWSVVYCVTYEVRID
jgi:ABC-type thiamin/hydroxymethylpyrimidine transport system permease subunit